MVQRLNSRLLLIVGIILVMTPILVTSQALASDHIRVPAGDVNAFWNSVSFADLTPAEQKAWAVLGWNAQNWEVTTDLPATEYTIWSQLSADQQAAAVALSYNPTSWNAFVIRKPSGDVNAFWVNIAYADTTPAEQKAWAVLGWNAQNWEATTDLPTTEYTIWSQLSADQQAAATSLGYNPTSWNDFVIRKPAGDVNTFWDTIAYKDLTTAEKKNWAVMGWNEHNWEATVDVPASAYQLWIQLSADQQAAATAFGYSQAYWDSIGFTKPTGDVNTFWNNIAYANLEPSDKNAWAALGWNAKNWDATTDLPDTEYMFWKQLSAIQQAAATALGYSKEYWDATVKK